MKDFEYAAPRNEAEVVGLLSARNGETAVLAGGTDLVPLMKQMIATPSRVVNIMEVSTFRGITPGSEGVIIGATTTLDEMLDSELLEEFPSVKQAIRGISSQSMQCQGTLGGEVCQRPRCWYFRNGHGLLANNGQLVTDGENRFHAIFGNRGSAKFVNPSRLAPALIALDARLRVVGPNDEQRWVPLANFYRTPRDENQREIVLEPNQVVTHVAIPHAAGSLNATYEIRHGLGPEYPLVSAAASLEVSGGMIKNARVVLGQVAPTPWISTEARGALVGRFVDEAAAEAAGEAATSVATPLSQNRYKVQLAKVAVKRAVLLAAGLETGGF